MNIKDALKKEFSLTSINEVQEKKGIHVFEVARGSQSYYLKHFENVCDANEIKCYKILEKTELPLIKYYDSSTTTILLENMTKDIDFRLGCADDYTNSSMISSVADWFRKLHNITRHNEEWFEFLEEDEVRFSIQEIAKCQAEYGDSECFNLLIENIDDLNNYLRKCKKIAIHDDFYYKNFFVNKNNYEVILFDFNFMKRGLISQELSLIRRNLRSASLDSELRFVEEYGEYNQMEYEIYSFWRHMSCLHEASTYDQYPKWASESKQKLSDGRLRNKLNEILISLKYQLG